MFFYYISLFLLVVLFEPTTAQDENIKPPDVHRPVGWQASPARRGTLDIIENCAITIFACTWTVQHLNVPGKKDHWYGRLFRTCKWMLINILLPEFLLTHAIFELKMALDALDKMAKEHPEKVEHPFWRRGGGKSKRDASTVSEEQGENVESGEIQPGWTIPFWRRRARSVRSASTIPEEKGEDVESISPGEIQPKWTIVCAYFANMGGFVYELPPDPDAGDNPSSDDNTTSENSESDSRSAPEIAAVNGIHFARYMKQFDPLQISQISQKDILDRSKSDAFAKTIAILQIAQLAFSLAVRYARRLPSSQIEILTLCLAVCGVVTFMVYWYKPKRVDVPITLRRRSESDFDAQQSQDAQQSDKDLTKDLQNEGYDSFWNVLKNAHNRKATLDRIPNDSIPAKEFGRNHSLTYLLAFVAAVFGGLHTLAWSFEFPTHAEQMTWRVGTIASIVVPVFGLLAIPLSQHTILRSNPRQFLRFTTLILDELVYEEEDDEKKRVLSKAHRELVAVYDQKIPFLDILLRGEDSPLSHIQQYIDDGRRPRIKSGDRGSKSRRHRLQAYPPGYKGHLQELDRMDVDAAAEVGKTNVFPVQPIANALNMAILYTTGFLYCASRLLIVAVGLSSLRSMPDGVYVATWTRYIPSLS